MHLLLLRGLVRETRHWGAFPALLEAQHPGVRVATLDLPGVGTEHARSAPDTMEATIDDLRSRFLGLRSRSGPGAAWGVVGISLGGLVGLAWAHRYPGDFLRAVAINSSAPRLARPWERLDPRNYPRVLEAFSTSDLGHRERLIIEMTINRTDLDRKALAAQYASYARERPVRRWTFFRQLGIASRVHLGPITCPVLVVASRGDRLVRPVCSERLAESLVAPLELHPSAGHDLPFDDGPWLSNVLGRWFSERTAS